MSGIRENRRKEILAAACREFGEKGVEAASMLSIARRAGVGKSTIYEYFPSKDDLLRQSCDQIWETVLARLDREFAAECSFREKVSVYYRQVAELLDQIGGDLSLLLASRALTDAVCQSAERFRAALLERVERLIRKAREDGELAPDLDTAAAAVFLISVPNPAMLTGMRRRGIENPMDTAAELVFRGIGK